MTVNSVEPQLANDLSPTNFDLTGAHFMRSAFGLVDSQLETVGKYMKQDFQTEGDSTLVDDWEYSTALVS